MNARSMVIGQLVGGGPTQTLDSGLNSLIRCKYQPTWVYTQVDTLGR